MMRIEARVRVHDTQGRDFHGFGPATKLLERLRKAPSGGGAEAVRSEFS